MRDKYMIKANVIAWNKNQFYRAIKDERWADAERYKDNIDKLEREEG